MRPCAGILLASRPSSQARAPGPLTVYFAKPVVSMRPTCVRTAATSAATVSKSVERYQLNSSRTPSGAYHSGTSSPAAAPNCAPRALRRS